LIKIIPTKKYELFEILETMSEWGEGWGDPLKKIGARKALGIYNFLQQFLGVRYG